MISIKNISFAYGENKIFDNFSIDIDERLCFLMGKNGAGKTTLLKLIHGDIKAFTGEIISDEAYMISQSFILFDDLSAIENIAIATDRSMAECKKLLKTSPFYIRGLERKLKELSTIERQTTELIAMSLSDKKLILLDEVSAALDGDTSSKLVDYIKTSDKSFIMVSHDDEFIKNFDAKKIYLGECNDAQAKHVASQDHSSKQGSILGIYLKDDAKLKNILQNSSATKSYAYVAKDVREALLMDEMTYKNIFIYDILKGRDFDYISRAQEFIKRYKLKFSAEDITSTLSGGNLQKLVFFREMLRDEDRYILYNYKKGMDFEAKALAQEEILRKRDEGREIIIISDDYEELKEDIVDEIKII